MKTAKQKNTTYFIKGMHCASCEVLIEKKLLKETDIKSADASLADNKVNISYAGLEPDLQKINKIFKDQKYTFSKSKFREKSFPLFRISNGQLQFNPAKFKQFLFLMAFILLLLVGFSKLESSGFGAAINVSGSSSLPTFFVFGLLAGASSCAALVGGMLLSLSKQWNEIYIAEDSGLKRSQPFILFNSGRILSYTLFGGVLGALGSLLGLSALGTSAVTSIVILLVSVAMILLGLQMLGVEWAQNFKLQMPKSLSRYASDEGNFKGRYMPFVSGALTFFVPCGFTLVAQGIALTSGNIIQGALIMLFFSLGTLPMLALISISSVKFATRPHLNYYFTKIAAILVLFFAIYNINGQLNLLGVPSLSDLKFDTGSTVEAEKPVGVETDGTQKLGLVAKGFAYIPTDGTTLTAGVKTVLEIDNQGISGCGAYLTARGLFNETVKLSPGINTVSFTPQKGTYKITCTMGMVPPVTVRVI